jgi:hypothetical protein
MKLFKTFLTNEIKTRMEKIFYVPGNFCLVEYITDIISGDT